VVRVELKVYFKKSFDMNWQLLICALGTISTDFGRESGLVGSASFDGGSRPNLQAQQYFSAAQKRLTSCLGRRGILEAQCFFYSGVYLATTLQPEAAWSMFLQAKTCCQSFGYFTQDRPRAEDFDSVLTRNESWVAEECTYWTCLKSEMWGFLTFCSTWVWQNDRELHLELNPPGFRVIDLWYPEKFPDPPREKIADSDESWFFYLAEIALRRLANRILTFVAQSYDMINPAELQLARDSAVEFEQEANDWYVQPPYPRNSLIHKGAFAPVSQWADQVWWWCLEFYPKRTPHKLLRIYLLALYQTIDKSFVPEFCWWRICPQGLADCGRENRSEQAGI
jgi:hypothetical protein